MYGKSTTELTWSWYTFLPINNLHSRRKGTRKNNILQGGNTKIQFFHKKIIFSICISKFFGYSNWEMEMLECVFWFEHAPLPSPFRSDPSVGRGFFISHKLWNALHHQNEQQAGNFLFFCMNILQGNLKKKYAFIFRMFCFLGKNLFFQNKNF